MTRFAIVFVFASLLSIRAASGVDVTTCGQVVDKGDFGVLVGDLTCAGTAVVLEQRATLDLAGFTITVTGPGPGAAVNCIGRRCAVHSNAVAPGKLLGNSGHAGIAMQAVPLGKVELRNLVIDGFLHNVQAATARVFATDVSVTGAASNGMIARRLDLDAVNATGNLAGLYATISIKFGVVTASNNAGAGMASGGKVKGTQLTASGNELGVVGSHVRLFNSSVTGNTNTDVVSLEHAPSLHGTACDTSSNTAPLGGTPWGVCALDP